MEGVDVPADVERELASFVRAAKQALGDDLVSIVLFGSAAEGRLRATSDVNLMLVLSIFEESRVNALREALRLAHAVIRLEAMIILESELAEAAEAFAVKLADIRSRHHVIAGKDVLASLAPSRGALLVRLRQILLNFVLRTRERYALVSLREEQLAAAVADAAGPLRSAAGIMLQLEGRSADSPREALETIARELDREAWQAVLADLSRAREEGRLAPGAGAPALLKLIELAQAMRHRVRFLAA